MTINFSKPGKLTKEEQLAKTAAAHAAKEKVFYLVTKIISWNTNAMDSHSMQDKDKITKDEWKKYEKHLLEISKSSYVEDVKEKLKKIFNTIQNNQGFE